MHRAFAIAAAWMVVGFMAILISVAVGSVTVGPQDWWRWWQGLPGSELTTAVVHLRVPRALAAFACGGLLAIAGALLQALLRNALAEPAVIGVSSGAGLGAVLALGWGGAWAVELGAGAGATLAVLILLGLYRKVAGTHSVHDGQAPARLILAGVMLSSCFAAGTALVLSVAPDAQLKGMLFWMMGDLSGADISWTLGFIWVAVALASLYLAPDLNLMLRGEAMAQSLGVAVARRRVQILAVAVLATAASVTVAGAIGFVGLVVPHILRVWVGNDQRILLPAAWSAGGACLCLADTAARTVLAPMELPVGVITALVGAPLFVVLLVRGQRG